MKLDLSQAHDQSKAQTYLAKLTNKQSMIELREIQPVRTNRQNAYAHALITEWAMQAGYTLDEMKYAVKAALGYVYHKNGVVMYRHTSAMDTAEMNVFIEKMRKLAADQGVDLMTPEEFEMGGWREIEKRREQMKSFL